MGGRDKGWIRFHNTPMVTWVIERLSPQVSDIIISANRHIKEYETFGYRVISDDGSPSDEYQGPIAGIIPCLTHLNTDYGLIVPCDTPCLSPDLAKNLFGAADSGKKLALYSVAGRIQPLFGLYHCDLVSSLKNYFEEGNRKLIRWCLEQDPHIVEFQGSETAFFNVNTPLELQQLENQVPDS